MNIYKLNHFDLGSLGFIAGKQSGSNIALSGCFDMPARIGKAFHSWADESGIEPYVSASDMQFGGRSLSLAGYIYGENRTDCKQKATSIFSLIDSFTDLVPLTCKWGTYQVYVNEPILGSFLGDQVLKITFNFREPLVEMNGLNPGPNGSSSGIDGISFKDLGGVLISSGGNEFSRAAPKSQNGSIWGREAYQITKTEMKEFSLKLFIDQPDLSSFRNKVSSLTALFSAPGIRTLMLESGSRIRFFVKDGFKISNVFSRINRMTGMLDCKIIEGDLNASNMLPPIVNAGSNKTIASPGSTILVTDASAIARSGSVILSILWEFVSSSNGIQGMVSEGNTLTTRLYGMSEMGTYLFRLTVKDSNGLTANSLTTMTVGLAQTTVWEDPGYWNDLLIWNEI